MRRFSIHNLSLVPGIVAVTAWAGLTVKAHTVSVFLAAICHHFATRLRLASALLFVSCVVIGSMASAAQTAHFSSAQSTVLFNPTLTPQGVALDGWGNVYIADLYNGRVLKETPTAAGYMQSTVVVLANGGLPDAIAVDRSGNVYVADTGYNVVFKETPSAGGYTQSTVYNSGLGWPTGVAVDGSGDVFIVGDSDGFFVKETPSGGGYIQSIISANLSNFQNAVAVDASGDVYIADYFRDEVFKETPSGSGYIQSAVAGGFINPLWVTVDGSGNVYVVDSPGNVVWKETLSAGSYTQSAVAAIGLSEPEGIAVDGWDNIYLADWNNHWVIKLSPFGGNFGTVNVGSTSTSPISAIFTFDTAGTLGSKAVVTQGATGLDFIDAGTGTCVAGMAYSAGDTCSVDVTFAPKFPGTRYGAAEILDDSGNVLATGYFQGTGAGPQVNFLPSAQSTVASRLKLPTGLAADGIGNVYVADTLTSRVLKETLSGGSYAQSTIPTGRLAFPQGVAVDGSGSVYIADTSNGRVLKETLAGGSYTQSTIPTSSLSFPLGVAVDADGNVYIADTGNDRVLKETLSEGSYTESKVPATGLGVPQGVAVDGCGNVYIADFGNGRVLKETLSAGSYTQSTIARVAGGVTKVAVDGSGNVYIATVAEGVLKETLSGGIYIQSRVASSILIEPQGVAVDASGNVYIADTLNQRVLKEDFADPPSLTFARTTEGLTSSDSPLTVTLENVGNAALTFPIPTTGTNPSISANFTLNSSGESACPLVTSNSFAAGTLAAGADCVLPISFTPETVGLINGSLVLTDNALDAAAPGYATQSILLSGTATRPRP